MCNERTFDETETITDEAFNQALETLIDDNCKEWKYLTIPEVDVDHYIIGHKKIQDEQDTNPKLFYGKIKNSIINWINEDNLKEYILTYQDAGFEHGGDGALFVYLRKKKF